MNAKCHSAVLLDSLSTEPKPELLGDSCIAGKTTLSTVWLLEQFVLAKYDALMCARNIQGCCSDFSCSQTQSLFPQLHHTATVSDG